MSKSILSCAFMVVLAMAAPTLLFAQTQPEALDAALPKVIFSCTVTTTDNTVHTLKNFTVSRLAYFNCKLRDSVFKIPFEKLVSLTLDPAPEPPFKGYIQGTLAWVGGGQVQVWVSADNYRIEGTEEKLGIVLKIPLSEITTIRITSEKLPEEKPTTPPASPAAGQEPAVPPAGDLPASTFPSGNPSTPSGIAPSDGKYDSTNYTFNWY